MESPQHIGVTALKCVVTFEIEAFQEMLRWEILEIFKFEENNGLCGNVLENRIRKKASKTLMQCHAVNMLGLR